MRTASLILITTLFSATSVAAPPDWKTTLDTLGENIQSEISLIQERIASLEKGSTLNPTTVERFKRAHQKFYETHCRSEKLNSNCAKWAQSSTDRDLNGIRGVLGLYELKDRLTWLDGRALDFLRYARVFQRPEQKLEDTLTWKPVRDVPTVVSPGQFVIKKPATIVEIQPASGEQRPAQAAEGVNRMRKLLALTAFLIITSAPAQADPEMDWFIALNVFQAAAQTEIDVIRDHLTPPAAANEAAMRNAREDRAAFITQHQELYKLSCAQLKPAKTYQQCSYAGHYAAERDLKAIGRMPAEELRSRIRHLQGVLERQEKLRSGAAGLKKEELKLQWSAVPSKSKAVTNVKHRVDFEAPRVFEVPKPVGVSSATAVYDSGAAKRLPATGPAVGEQQPAGGGGGRLIITRPVD